MEYLNSYDRDKALAVVLGSQTLREKFENKVWEDESFWMDEKLSCFERGSIDYEYGLCCYSWIRVKSDWEALRGVEEAIRTFGADTKVERLAKQTRRLYESNLFPYMVEKLVQAWFESEILYAIKYVEDVGYAIYMEDAAKVEELAGDSFDLFIENGYLDDYYEEDGAIWQTVAVK